MKNLSLSRFRRSRFHITLPARFSADEDTVIITLSGRHRPERVATAISVWDLRDREAAPEWTATEGQHHREEEAA